MELRELQGTGILARKNCNSLQGTDRAEDVGDRGSSFRQLLREQINLAYPSVRHAWPRDCRTYCMPSACRTRT